MRVLDPGHDYELTSFDGGDPVRLTFVKRNDPPEKYPGNNGAYPGTQIQEVLRALIERAQYVNNQIPCPETESAIDLFRQGIYLFESRHVNRHDGLAIFPKQIETAPFCSTCGHIYCFCEGSNGKPG